MDSGRAKRLVGELLNQTVADWHIIEFLAPGRSALVFKAMRDGIIEALKIFDADLIERFGERVQEGRINRQLSLCGKEHPNLVKIVDGGRCSKTGLWYVVMGLIDAPVASTVLQDIPRDRIWPIISHAAAAARFLEQLSLAHRDIKPSNIAVSRDFQKATLLDLGVIRPFGETGLTDEEQRIFVGTLQYSSPEFLFRTEEDTEDGWRALSFYQLGAVLHDLIMKKPLFSEFANPYARLVDAVKYETPRVEADNVPADLVLLAKNCLSKDPKLRLRLVKWEDFEPRIVCRSSAIDAKERIRKRHLQARETSPLQWNEAAEQKLRAERRTIETISGKIQSIIRQECIGSDLFPPIEIHDNQVPLASQVDFLVFFPASNDHCLNQSLSICVELHLLDMQSEALQVFCAAASASDRIDHETAASCQKVMIFQSVFEEAVIQKLMQDVLYVLLDQAQQLGTSSRETKWLDVPLPQEEVEEHS